MTETVAFCNGAYLPFSEVGLGLDDAGVVSGATITERLRTYSGKLFAAQEHVQRFREGLSYIGTEPPAESELLEVAGSLLSRNGCDSGRDLAVVFVGTPGRRPGQPTLIAHVVLQPRPEWSSGYSEGWTLVSSTVAPLPSDAVARTVKHRSRLHWYRAQQAIHPVDLPTEPLLFDPDGVVTESCYGNIVAVRERRLTAVSRARALAGVTEAAILKLAEQAGMSIEYADMTRQDLLTADEILLTSTGYTVAPVTRIDETPIGGGVPGPIWSEIRHRFHEVVGADFVSC